MAKRRNDDDESSGSNLRGLLLLVILGGLGYLAYTHQQEIESFDYSSINLESLKRLVGLAGPEASSTGTMTNFHPPPTPVPTAVPETTASSTNGAPVPTPVPLVGRPRAVLPAHDHWTWTTTDGKTYQDVKVEKIESDYVTIIYADGGARLLISTLPDDVQKEINYYSSQE